MKHEGSGATERTPVHDHSQVRLREKGTSKQGPELQTDQATTHMKIQSDRGWHFNLPTAIMTGFTKIK